MTQTTQTQTKIEAGDTVEFRAGHFWNTVHNDKIEGCDEILVATVVKTYISKIGNECFSFVVSTGHDRFGGIKHFARISRINDEVEGFKIVARKSDQIEIQPAESFADNFRRTGGQVFRSNGELR